MSRILACDLVTLLLPPQRFSPPFLWAILQVQAPLSIPSTLNHRCPPVRGADHEGGDANFTTSTTAGGSTGDAITGSLPRAMCLSARLATIRLPARQSRQRQTQSIQVVAPIQLPWRRVIQQWTMWIVRRRSGQFTPGLATRWRPGSIVDATDHPQLGWWWASRRTGQLRYPLGRQMPPALFLNGGGTSADMSKVTNFVTGSALLRSTRWISHLWRSVTLCTISTERPLPCSSAVQQPCDHRWKHNHWPGHRRIVLTGNLGGCYNTCGGISARGW